MIFVSVADCCDELRSDAGESHDSWLLQSHDNTESHETLENTEDAAEHNSEVSCLDTDNTTADTDDTVTILSALHSFFFCIMYHYVNDDHE